MQGAESELDTPSRTRVRDNISTCLIGQSDLYTVKSSLIALRYRVKQVVSTDDFSKPTDGKLPKLGNNIRPANSRWPQIKHNVSIIKIRTEARLRSSYEQRQFGIASDVDD